MNRLLRSIALVPLAACAVHIHIHEAPKSDPPKSEQSAAAPLREEAKSGEVSGVVVDAQGRPVHARVAAVGPSGSRSCSTDGQGRFELEGLQWPEFVLHVSTDDDRLAVQSGVRLDTKNVHLLPEPAAVATMHVDGVGQSRCAVFHDGVRVEDFTIRGGKPSRVVLPAGEIRVQLYEGEKILHESTFHLEVGEHLEVGCGTLGEKLPGRSS